MTKAFLFGCIGFNIIHVPMSCYNRVLLHTFSSLLTYAEFQFDQRWINHVIDLSWTPDTHDYNLARRKTTKLTPSILKFSAGNISSA